MLKTCFNKPVILDIFGECERKLNKLLTDSATEKSEAYFPIKMRQQESNEKVVYLSRTRKRMIRSKMLIDKINDTNIKLGKK